MTPAGSPATPEPHHPDTDRTDDTTRTAQQAPDAFTAFRLEGQQRRQTATQAEPGRPLDWADPDPTAAVALPAWRHPVERVIARQKEGKPRQRFMYQLSGAHRRLVALGTGAGTDAYTYPWHQLTPELAAEYRRDVYAYYPRQSSRNDAVSVVRRIVAHCHRAGLMSALRRDELLDELYTVAPGPSTRRRRITDHELGALLNACERLADPKAVARDSAMIAVLRTSGMRVGELVKLDLADWDRVEGTLLLRDTKNGLDHTVFLHAATVGYLTRWVAMRREAPGALFTPMNGALRHLHPYTVRQRLQAVREDAGVRNFSPHDFRRTFATELLRGHDPALVGKLLNHTKLSSTLIYDLAPEEDQRAAVAGLHLPTPPLPGTDQQTRADHTEGVA